MEFNGFSNSESIKAEIHDNNVNASNILELSSPTLELDVSDIITTTVAAPCYGISASS